MPWTLPSFGARRRARPEEKTSRVARLIALDNPGRAVWTPRDYASLAREGYARNPVVFRCVRLIAEQVANVPLLVREGRTELDEHPMLALLNRPNPRQPGPAFLEAVTSHLLLAGNAYVEAVTLDGRIVELYALRPDRMRVVAGPEGWPASYDYTVGNQSVRFTQDGAVPPILHIALFHPVNDHYGLAPLEAAQVSLDVLNAAASWNKALLDNSARPSGALVYAPPTGGTLSREQFDRLKEELELSFQGAGNAGRPLLLEGGLDWKQLSLTPRDLDFVEAKNAAAREVALAFGVPPQLLGIKGDATYSNYQEANKAFWRQTVLPLLGRLCRTFEHWLAPALGDVTLWYDADAIDALSGDREALWARIGAAQFLTEDEKREAVGYGRRGTAGDEAAADEQVELTGLAQKYAPDQPRVPKGEPGGGQWTSGGAGGEGRVGDRSGGPDAQLAQADSGRATDALPPLPPLRTLGPVQGEAPQVAEAGIQNRLMAAARMLLGIARLMRGQGGAEAARPLDEPPTEPGQAEPSNSNDIAPPGIGHNRPPPGALPDTPPLVIPPPGLGGDGRAPPRAVGEEEWRQAKRLLNEYRVEWGMPDLGDRAAGPTSEGTAAVTNLNGVAVYGVNSTSPAYTTADRAAARDMRATLIREFPQIMQLENIGRYDNSAVFHAEATIVLRAATANGGSLVGQELTVYVDRDVCGSCEVILPAMGLLLGNPTITFVGPDGILKVVRDGSITNGRRRPR